MHYAYIPPIWRVWFSLVGGESIGVVDETYARAMRSHLGFDAPVDEIMLIGGKRSGKTEGAAFYCQNYLDKGRSYLEREKIHGWVYQSTKQQSRLTIQPSFYKYHHPEHKKLLDISNGKILGRGSDQTRISYTTHSGYSNEMFVVNGNKCVFKYYGQKLKNVHGAELDFAALDEIFGLDLVDEMRTRLTTRYGKLFLFFTPTDGWSDVVEDFHAGATLVKSSIGFLLPRDGGPPDEEKAQAQENCDNWLFNLPSQPEPEEGREFVMVPRVLKCRPNKDRERAIVYLHSSDNLWAPPKNVIAITRNKSLSYRMERFYGMAERRGEVKWPSLDEYYHFMPRKDIPFDDPTAKLGFRFLVVDPAGEASSSSTGRNYAMAWFYFYRPLKGNPILFVYDEWPGEYHIDAIGGHPGPWAEPGGAAHPDGKRGPAQKNFSLGFVGYKEQIMAREKWSNYLSGCPADAIKGQWLAGLRPPEDESIPGRRYMDPYSCARPWEFDGEMTTVLQEFEKLGLYFVPGPRKNISDSVMLVQDLLNVDKSRPRCLEWGKDYNTPRLIIAEECKNTYFCMKTWTHKEGEKGATKDFCDVIRIGAGISRDMIRPAELNKKIKQRGHY